MKNRARIITAFLLCACLIVGVGFAQITENLFINGSAKFNNFALLEDDIVEAVKFTENMEGDESATPTFIDTENVTMTVVINDTVGTLNQVYTATATYEVIYDSTDLSPDFPDVHVSVRTATITNGLEGMWDIDVSFVVPDGSGALIEADAAHLHIGDTINVVVTVTCNNTVGGEVVETTDAATITVQLDAVPYIEE